MREKLKLKEIRYITLMIFGIFFGAGNLIFPPVLGKESGSNLIVALIFFGISAVMSPMLGVYVSVKMGGMNKILDKIDPYFKNIYPLLIYISLGPGLAIPRAASTAFEITNKSFNNNNEYEYIYRLIFTLIFFLIVYYLALNPNKIFVNIGKILTPILISLILLVFIILVFKEKHILSTPTNEYMINPSIKGFLEGYNTMDGLGALIVGYTIINTFKNLGIKNEKVMLRYTLKTVTYAGLLIFSIYSILSYIGAITSRIFPNTTNGAEILSNIMEYTLGNFGLFLLTSIFIIACLTVSMGLGIIISTYFNENYEILKYKNWIRIIFVVSFILSNFGLNKILKLSIPVLLILYPVTLVLIILPLLTKNDMTYKLCVYTSFITSIISVLNQLGIKNLNFIEQIPFNSLSMSWIITTSIAYILSIIYYKLRKK